ncbi:MAG: TylF/MycF/NovP-related O-methyltransferase [Phycisphaerales bacterium]|nr:TylF/MycF family methyltransferase [Planctomycetota bacterium]
MKSTQFTEQAWDHKAAAEQLLATIDGGGEANERYLELLKRCLMRIGMESRYEPLTFQRVPSLRRSLYSVLTNILGPRYEIVRRRRASRKDSLEGRKCSYDAESMIGQFRMNNLHDAVRTIMREGVPGDLVEAGVWRGGATIFLRAALWAYGDQTRKVWAADSFEGLPKPNKDIEADAGYDLSSVVELSVSLEDVQENFKRYGWLDDRVKFLKGWFKDTLPTAPIESIALLRADGDLYESTMDVLRSLYDKVSPGGFVVIDDYGAWPPCRKAVDEFRAARGITDPIEIIDWSGVYWRKGK